jgi:FKBP-type peptidyl-prolyl cis-trans isomerase SlyD
MDNKQSKYITVSYQLYSINENGEKHLEEQTQQGNPFRFISGFGFTLDAFEQHIADLQPGEKFDFILQPSEAFGDYDERGIHKMKREDFCVNGHFDHENIFPGAIITLLDKEEEDRHFMARVTSVEEDGVTIDVNHPLAGFTLQFTGVVLENRDATNEEIQQLLNHMSHECCGCDDCEGHEHESGCGCGHCHH